VIYCVVPPELEDELYAKLVEHYNRWGLVWGSGPHRVRYSVAFEPYAFILAADDMVREAGVRVCIATDSPASTPSFDMFDELRAAIRLILRTTHNLAEGAGAASTAAALKLRTQLAGKTVVGILSGGNLDLATLRAILA